MYIEQVITACDTFYPNPYTKQEKYFWCDELSELLTIKFNTVYEREELSGTGGIYLLPEGVTASMIESVICGGKTLRKCEFVNNGIECSNKELYIPKNKFDRVYVIYIKPYEKIRDVEFTDTLEFGADYFITNENNLRAGDGLSITIGDTTYDNVFVLGQEFSEDGKIKVLITGAEFEAGEKEASVRRHVMEETVCPPPYDSMYIDYVLGKICYYQNDFDACNHHMSLYNSKLLDYRNWVKSHPVSDYRVTNLKNWW